jgi:hypothetical protein
MGTIHPASFRNQLASENDEDAGEEGDDPWNKAEVKSEHCN